LAPDFISWLPLNQEWKFTPQKNEENHSPRIPEEKPSRRRFEEDFFAKPSKKITPRNHPMPRRPDLSDLKKTAGNLLASGVMFKF